MIARALCAVLPELERLSRRSAGLAFLAGTLPRLGEEGLVGQVFQKVPLSLKKLRLPWVSLCL